MIYFTQLIYLHPGGELVFDQFEDVALPLIAKYNGKLLFRLRPEAAGFIENSIEQPYEIHLVSFENRQDFEQFAKDPARQQHLHLKDQSVEKIVLIEGKML